MESWNKVSFFVNVFPTTSHDWENIKCDIDRKIIYIRHLFEFHSSVNITPEPKYWCFKTDKIFLNCCQSDIYTSVMDQVIESTLIGVDSVVLIYGQNHSGKTFTATGLQNEFHLRGIVPRFIFDLMKLKKDREDDISTEISLSSVDIFGDSLYDLLKKSRLKCKHEQDVRRVSIKSGIHGLELLFKAEAARMTVDERTYNAHAATNVITLFVQIIPLSNQDTFNKQSKIHFVDMPGVETIERCPATSIKDKKTQGDANITKTMLQIFALQCSSRRKLRSTNVLMNKNRTHMITKYLGKSLSPVSNLKLICHIRPNREDLGITLSLLKFGMSFLNITMLKPQPNVEINEKQMVKNLKEEIQEFKDDILVKQMCGKTDTIDISQDRVEFVKRSVVLYLNNEISEQELLALVDDCSIVLKLIKTINKENIPCDNISMGLQTDFLSELKTSLTEDKDNTLDLNSSRKVTLTVPENTRVSLSEEKQKTHAQIGSSKQKKSGKSEPKSTKSEKTTSGIKGAKLAKVLEKPIQIEAEVQVNLIEPKAKLPTLNSREGLWALFLTSNPEVQVLIDKISLLINRKEKIYNEELTRLEKTTRSLNRVQIELNKLASYRHTESTEMYNHEGQVVISSEESKLARQLSGLKEESLIIQQNLIGAQTDWLDSLERMNCEKLLIDTKFNAFCVQNNLLAITQELAAQKDMSPEFKLSPHKPCAEFPENVQSNHNEILEFETKAPSFDDFQDHYVALQTKYLKR